MQRIFTVVGVIFAVSLLVIIHEFGHYLVARAFGMRVLTYSIGFGPVMARWRPKGSDTVFQVCAIPMLGYVQVAGMNPSEVVDPKDRGSYANARPLARFLMILAGPLANYLAALIAVFFLLALGGEQLSQSARATVDNLVAGRPAIAAGLRPNDTIVAIDGVATPNWMSMVEGIRGSNGRTLTLRIERDGASSEVRVTPSDRCCLRRSDSSAHGESTRYPTLSKSLAFEAPRLCDTFSRYAVSFSAAMIATSAFGTVIPGSARIGGDNIQELRAALRQVLG